MFLIFKGFNEIIAIRLPKQTVKKRVAIELALSLYEPQKYVKGYLGSCRKFFKSFSDYSVFVEKTLVLVVI
jgi:hypothetical protein